MHHFDDIFRMAADRHGGAQALEAKLGKPKSAAELAALPEDRWLSIITKTVFQAGFNWKVIEAKWDGFETAFDDFDVGRCAFMDDEKFDSLLQDTRIVRKRNQDRCGTRQRSLPAGIARGRRYRIGTGRLAIDRFHRLAGDAGQTWFAVGRHDRSVCDALCGAGRIYAVPRCDCAADC